jgi:hypothetical protein
VDHGRADGDGTVLACQGKVGERGEKNGLRERGKGMRGGCAGGVGESRCCQ